MKKFNKNDIKEGDVYAFSNSEGDVLCEIVETNIGLQIKPLKFGYWKPVYESIENDYLTDFNAILVYRRGRGW